MVKEKKVKKRCILLNKWYKIVDVIVLKREALKINIIESIRETYEKFNGHDSGGTGTASFRNGSAEIQSQTDI
ncbi:hypothetical protein [Ruminiclostridium cellobioparum]|uniref:hypothetical protein n=1 Tax=Ruminiclostridium cellobioparum TaxID=29355 RepID=UPI0013F41F7D|nr:hypothetical protein [Ruminiclostridium cellobioparum]